MANNPAITDLAPNQEQLVFTNHNDSIAAIEAAENNHVSLTISATPTTLTATQFWSAKAFEFVYGSPSAGSDITINVPAVDRVFLVENSLEVNLTVQVSGQSTPPVLPIRGKAWLRCNGTRVDWAVIPTFQLSAAEYAAITPNASAYYIIT